jgi:hypothetical protein
VKTNPQLRPHFLARSIDFFNILFQFVNLSDFLFQFADLYNRF